MSRNAKDITGQRFGRLTAIERTNKKDKWGQSWMWRCCCDCGTEVSVSISQLGQGIVRSCGCFHDDSHIKDLTGKRFGRLLAICPTGKSYNQSAIWECYCDCGQRYATTAESLIWGNKRSCGCMKHEKRVTQIIALKDKIEYSDRITISRMQSLKLNSKNTSGYRGVSWYRYAGKWRAYIQIKGKLYFLGYYDNRDEAVQIRKEAEQLLFEDFIAKYEAGEFGKKSTN